jgi:hypothetical protein
VDGSTGLAYVASSEFGLSVVNVSNPGAPVVVGAANGPFYGQRVAVSGGLGVVACRSLGMKVVDLATVSAPRTIGSLPDNVDAVDLVGQTAYALVTGAGQPVPGRSRGREPGDAVESDDRRPRVARHGRVGPRGRGLACLRRGGHERSDRGQRREPECTGRRRHLEHAGNASDVTVANGYAYVADGRPCWWSTSATRATP